MLHCKFLTQCDALDIKKKLNRCADYVKHLVKKTKEKEAAVERTKSDLSIKEQKLEEDKVLQESRSDPESVMSSISSSSVGLCSGTDDKDHGRDSNINDVRNCVSLLKDSGGHEEKKDHLIGIGGNSIDVVPLSIIDDCENTISAGDGVKWKKVRLIKEPEEGSISSIDSSSDEGGGSRSSGPGGKNISLDKMSSNLLVMTDSNRSSSKRTSAGNVKGSNIGGVSSEKTNTFLSLRPLEDDDTGTTSGDEPSSDSISSTAVVIRGAGSSGRQQKYADIFIKKKNSDARDGGCRKKRHRRECTSLEGGFDLNYEEVFLTSNVPQLIATPAGRIVTCKMKLEFLAACCLFLVMPSLVYLSPTLTQKYFPHLSQGMIFSFVRQVSLLMRPRASLFSVLYGLISCRCFLSSLPMRFGQTLKKGRHYSPN